VYVNSASASATDSGTGSANAPYKTIAAAMRSLRPGDDVIVATGTYRESVVVRAEVARTALIKGSVEVAGWTQQSADTYVVTWTGDEPEQVFRDGMPLQQIGGTVFGGYPNNPSSDLAQAHAAEGGIWPGRLNGGVGQLTADSFTYDANTRQLVVKLARPLAANEKLEVSAQRYVLKAENATGLTVDGLAFAHSNTSVVARHGAVVVNGSNNLLKNLQITDMDASCVQLAGSDSTLTDSTIDRCGQVGITGRGTRMSIVNNVVMHANTRGFNVWWEAGGMKLIGDGGLHQSVVRGNVVAYNTGDGIWVDWKNTNNLIENNTAAYNSGMGIQYEASQSGTIRGNLTYGNAMRGIYLMESSDCVVENNSVFGNGFEGIAVVNGSRSASDSSLLPSNNRITKNSVAWNDYQRNWVQLVLPGSNYNSSSDSNVFKTSGLGPRMSIGFMSTNNPAFDGLSAWRNGARADFLSTEQTVNMPDALSNSIAARRLLGATDLPIYLATPGTQ
jgi:parallel beta-helix repeat protein